VNINKAASQLEHQGWAILSLTEGISDGEVHWKPETTSWSILEVLNHLIDEEILDFRRHLAHILYTPQQPWPEIDPQGWVTQNAYNQRSLSESRMNFQTEREASIAWLLERPFMDLDASIELDWGPLTAGDMLASWLAHDLLHIRQLIELHYQLTVRGSRPYSILYAGEW